MNDNTNIQQTTGAVTIDDVRIALGDTDPASTNANAIRTIIGRGSFATIQRHLEALRAESVAAVSNEQVQTPKAPSDLISQIWSLAWSAAESSVNKQLSNALSQIDALQNELDALKEDRDSLLVVADDAEQAASDARALASDAVEHQKRLCDAYENLQKQHDTELSNEKATKAAMLHEHQLAQAHWETERVTLKAELDRVIDRLAETKSLLHEKRQASIND